MNYRVKTPWVLKQILYRKLIWDFANDTEPAVYLTFDDGPHRTATPYVLEQLEKYDAKATFFCIGKNVVQHPDIFKAVIKDGHTVANHTHNHKNGWKTKADDYVYDTILAGEHIKSKLFRPPYGRITREQIKRLSVHYKIIMWDVLSGDFDTGISPEKCLQNVISNVRPGSIIVFHDSEKAWDRMNYALPKVLEYCKNKSWQLKAIQI